MKESYQYSYMCIFPTTKCNYNCKFCCYGDENTTLPKEDIFKIMDLADFSISKPELSALFRKAGHKHYRTCKDQILRKFLTGVQLKYRDNVEKREEFKWE